MTKRSPEFKRPDHNDFRDSAELKKIRFSGLRHNSISDYMELWIDGEVKLSVSKHEYALNPNILTKALQEAFALDDVKVVPIQPN